MRYIAIIKNRYEIFNTATYSTIEELTEIAKAYLYAPSATRNSKAELYDRETDELIYMFTSDDFPRPETKYFDKMFDRCYQ